MANRAVTFSPADQALKRETRAAIAAAGGQRDAAAYCRIGQQTLSDCGSPNVDRFLPLDAARDLDAVTRAAAGWPIMLRAMAVQLGCGVVPLPEALPCSGDWHRQIAQLTKEQADVIAPLMDALGDGKLCAKDVRERELIRETQQVIQLWVTILAMLEQAAGGE